MASRRMFNLKLVDSAKFLKMPSSSQLLYFHLVMRADDDGVVEGFNVLRMTGLNEDDLKMLITKGYVQILNDDLVSFITDWKEHNLIRADRKVDSIYKELLLKVIPNTELVKPKERADAKKRKEGQPKDVQRSTEGQHSIGKVRLGKDSTDKKEKGSNLDNIISNYTENKDLMNTLSDFLKTRKSIKKPMTDRAMTLLLNKLDKLGSNDNDKIEILNQSILNSWQGIFSLKVENKNEPKEEGSDLLEKYT